MPLFSEWKQLSNNRDRRAEAARELEKRRGRSATYTQELRGETVEDQEDIHSFLTEFYGRLIFDYAPDMKQLLRQYPDTVGTHYSLLVPDPVSFDQFWARYYYRCSVTTVLQEWQQRDVAESALRSTVTNALVPTMQSKFLKQEIERGLGSRAARTAPATPAVAPAAGTSGNSNTRNAGKSGCPLLLEQRAAARASIFHAESISDIVETIAERGAGGDEEMEEGDQEQNAIGIGFAASG